MGSVSGPNSRDPLPPPFREACKPGIQMQLQCVFPDSGIPRHGARERADGATLGMTMESF
jgi:hypothetical protein